MDNLYLSSTKVRSNFSETFDNAVYDRPQFINRTRDNAVLIGAELMKSILAKAIIHYSVQYDEESPTYVITNDELKDIIAYGDTIDEALADFRNSLIEYAHEYYDEFDLYRRAPNRKAHLPYIIKILMIDNPDKLQEMLVCQDGKN